MPRLPANKWVTMGSCFGLAQQLLHVALDTDVECQWRERVGWLTTSSGSFRRSHSFRLFNQTAQIRSPVETSYESHYDRVPDVISAAH
jgi:hypothetical protein